MRARFAGEEEPWAAAPGESLLALARRAGRTVGSACDGVGVCGRCLLQVRGPGLPAPTAAEAARLAAQRLGPPWRLACQIADCDADLDVGSPLW